MTAGLIGCKTNEIPSAPESNQQEIDHSAETTRIGGAELAIVKNDPGLIAPPTDQDTALSFYGFQNTINSVIEIQNIVDRTIELRLIKPRQLVKLQEILNADPNNQGKLTAASIELLEIRQEIFNQLANKTELNPAETELLTILLKTNPQHYALLLFEQYGLDEYDNESINEAVKLFSDLHDNIIKALSQAKITAREAIQASRGKMDGSEETGFDNFKTIDNYLKGLNDGSLNPVRPGETIPKAQQFKFDEEEQKPGEPPKLRRPGYGWRETTTQLTTGEQDGQGIKSLDSIVIPQQELFEILQNNFSLAP